MLNYRVIPSLLLSNGGLVKTKEFKDAVYVGDAINAIRIFNEKEVDELVLLDIRASLEGLEPDFGLIEAVASECFMPFAYGGGVSTVEQVRRLLRIGAEKIVINTALHHDPNFVRDAVKLFGSQSIIASIDIKRKFMGRYQVMMLSGSVSTKKKPVDFARYVEELGVGEILLTSIDREGSMSGYDIEMLAEVCDSVNIPVIASGGAGNLDHFRLAVELGKASALAAGSMFVFHGPHRAVLISYPKYEQLRKTFE